MNILKNYLYLTLLFLLSCSEVEEDGKKTYLIKVSDEKSAYLEDIATNIKYLPLNTPEGMVIGGVRHIKCYDGLLFVHDKENTITVFDSLGTYIARLDKKGKGPGEYINIWSFSFDKTKRQLIISDNSSFVFYTIPELTHVKTVTTDQSLKNFEVLSEGQWLTLVENYDVEANPEVQIWNKDQENVSDLLLNDPASIELSYANTVMRNVNDVYYAYPNEYTTIFKIDGNSLRPLFDIDFGENKIEEKYWKMEDMFDFEELLEEGNPKAMWVHNFSFNNNKLAFWFLYKDIATRYLSVYDRISGYSAIYSEVKLRDLSIKLPAPMGVIDGRHISMIYPEAEQIPVDLLPARSSASTPVLVLYNLID